MERLPALPQKELPGLKTVAQAATIRPVPWPAGDMGEDEKEALMFRQAITRTDRDTVEGHGGFDVVMEEVVQWERETPASDGRKRIDDFRLAGSRTWRRRGVHLSEGGVTPKGDMIVTPAMLLSQRAEPSPLWSRLCPETRIGQGLARIARAGCNQAKRGCASRVPLLARRNGAPHGRGEGGESDPGFFGAGAPRAGVKVDRGPDTFTPLVFGGRSHHSDPWREGH